MRMREGERKKRERRVKEGGERRGGYIHIQHNHCRGTLRSLHPVNFMNIGGGNKEIREGEKDGCSGMSDR